MVQVHRGRRVHQGRRPVQLLRRVRVQVVCASRRAERQRSPARGSGGHALHHRLQRRPGGLLEVQRAEPRANGAALYHSSPGQFGFSRYLRHSDVVCRFEYESDKRSLP